MSSDARKMAPAVLATRRTPALAAGSFPRRTSSHSSLLDDDAIVERESSTGNMGIVRIDGPDDPRVSAYHAVRDADLVRARGLFVAEGRLVVERLIEDGRFPVQSMLLSEAALRAIEPALSTLAPGLPVYVCAAGDFPGIAGYDVHRGCLALAAR